MNSERTPLVAANWKANMDWDSATEFIDKLRLELPDFFDLELEPEIDVLICPPFPYISLLGTLLEEASIYLGGQDVSRFEGGAYTGDVSAAMLGDLECDFAIIGHSERRNSLGDTDAVVAQKLAQAREEELVPVLCIGEALDVREAGNAVSFTLGQLDALKAELARFGADRLAIAYEPVWAIGTGKTAAPQDAQEMAAAIRGWLKDNLSAEHAAQTPVLYGGSVKPDNAREFFAQPDIDGALVGGASLDANSFAELINMCMELRNT
jgi:triosephosphate isomerase